MNGGRKHANLQEMPLSRLIIELDASEDAYGDNSPTVRVLARVLRDRLRGLRQKDRKPDGPSREEE